MKKTDKIIYWIATGWLSLGMLSGGIAQFLQVKETIDGIVHLGYPPYLVTVLGFWKILGVIAILVPKFPLVKEWAYAGFIFVMTGALYSHIMIGDPAKESFGPMLLIVLTIVSWYFRPTDRKVASSNSR
jgi:uncharacterized membrane protein